MGQDKTPLTLIRLDDVDFEVLTNKFAQVFHITQGKLRSRDKRIITVQLGKHAAFNYFINFYRINGTLIQRFHKLFPF